MAADKTYHNAMHQTRSDHDADPGCRKIFYSDFGLFYQATGGIPASLYNVASTFDTYIYKAIQSSAPIGKTAAASFFQSVCCCATILLTNWLVKKVDEDSAII